MNREKCCPPEFVLFSDLHVVSGGTAPVIRFDEGQATAHSDCEVTHKALRGHAYTSLFLHLKTAFALNDAYLSVPAKTFPSLGLHIFEDYIKEVLTKGVGFSTSKSPDPVFATWDETSNIAPSTREEQVLPSLVTWK